MGDRSLQHEDSPKQFCQVCGEQANGVYFGAHVCLPCKTFFIRCTGESFQSFHCKSSGQCDIMGVSKRSACKFCRFKKCQKVGMARKSRPEVLEAAQGQDLCQVCGDLANGIHFGTLTCEGCKKFFARGEKEASTYTCKCNSACVINPRTRNFCRYCRYKKCIDVGMNKGASRIGRPRKLGQDSPENWLTSKSDESNACSTELKLQQTFEKSHEGNDDLFVDTNQAGINQVSPQQKRVSLTSPGNLEAKEYNLDLDHGSKQCFLNDANQTSYQKAGRQRQFVLKESPHDPQHGTNSVIIKGDMNFDHHDSQHILQVSQPSILPEPDCGNVESPKDIKDLSNKYMYKDAEDYAAKLSEMIKGLSISSKSLTGQNLHYLNHHFDNNYWLKTDIAISPTFTKEHQALLDKIVQAYDVFLQVADTEPPAMPVVWNANEPDPAMADYISARIMLHVSAGITFIQSVPGIENIPRTDIAILLRYAGIESGILTASCKWYNFQTRSFKHFYDMEIDPTDPSYYFKEATLDFAARIYKLNIDRVECAIMNALLFIASDFPGLQNVEEIEKIRGIILEALSAYTTEMYSASSLRLKTIFAFIPALRRLGQWHYQISMQTTLKPVPNGNPKVNN